MEMRDQLRLMLVTGTDPAGRPLAGIVEAALRGGVTAVMLREKTLATRTLYELASELRRLTADAGALLIVNDRVDIALAVGADGVHLGWQSLPLDRVRGILGSGQLVGVSTHSPEEARKAADGGADYVTFGPVFPTPSKEGLVEVQGLSGVRRASEGLGIPLLGLGGIDVTNARDVAASGATGIALIRGLVAAPDPELAACELLREVAEGAGG